MKWKGACMKRRYRAILTFILVAALMVFLSGCDAYRAAAKASDDVSSSVTSGIQTVADLYAQKLVDQGEKNGIATILQQITTGNQQFRANVKTIHARGTTTKAEYLQAANDFVGSARTLLESGAVHVKNPAAQAKVDTALQAVQTALTGIVTAIQNSNGGK
jgi:hypothetical protein